MSLANCIKLFLVNLTACIVVVAVLFFVVYGTLFLVYFFVLFLFSLFLNKALVFLVIFFCSFIKITGTNQDGFLFQLGCWPKPFSFAGVSSELC